MTINGSQDLNSNRSWLSRFITGSSSAVNISKPYGVASRAGFIYICDADAKAIEIVDLEKGEMQLFAPRGLGAFVKPINVFVDESGYLFVADTGRKQVLIFDSNLEFVSAIGDGKSETPSDVYASRDTIWVTNLSARSIDLYSRESLQKIGSMTGTDADSVSIIYSPVNLAVRSGKTFVSDFGDNRVKIFRQDGTFERAFGGPGRTPGRFARPKGIAVSRDGTVYVVDSVFENVQMFDSSGRILMYFGGPYEGPGYMWLPAKVAVDYDNTEFFKDYVYEKFDLQYLIYVTNQFGPDKVNVYGFVTTREQGDNEL